MIRIPSMLLEQAVEELSRLPGIGRRTALRLSLWMLKQEPENIKRLGETLIRLSSEAVYCSQCFNISDDLVCSICADPGRDHSVLCVVQDVRDVMAIEQTGQYRGLYHVLGGIISPLEGIAPGDLHIEELLDRLQNNSVNEVIMALNSSVEGDTTTFYIFRRIDRPGLNITTIARGIAVGDELEYTDEITLGRSILNRIPYGK
ncbi:MAG TPA: recombination mediator RecR [Bacteroidales bacterium]|nr:recombination mediator RecR [Bacteroidales bacterium]HRZ47808.1 recombination mediator RecR [Bacteroidales bacterium]